MGADEVPRRNADGVVRARGRTWAVSNKEVVSTPDFPCNMSLVRASALTARFCVLRLVVEFSLWSERDKKPGIENKRKRIRAGGTENEQTV